MQCFVALSLSLSLSRLHIFPRHAKRCLYESFRIVLAETLLVSYFDIVRKRLRDLVPKRSVVVVVVSFMSMLSSLFLICFRQHDAVPRAEVPSRHAERARAGPVRRSDQSKHLGTTLDRSFVFVKKNNDYFFRAFDSSNFRKLQVAKLMQVCRLSVVIL